MPELYKYMVAGTAKDEYTVTALLRMLEAEEILNGKITQQTIIPFTSGIVFQAYFDKVDEDLERIARFNNCLERLVNDGDLLTGKLYKGVDMPPEDSQTKADKMS